MRFSVWVLWELGSLLQFDDKMPEVITGNGVDILPVWTQEFLEVSDTGGSPEYCLWAFTFSRAQIL